jgi:hypothetical protein
MPQIIFTPTLQRHVKVPPREVEGGTVREVLDRLFAETPGVRGYVLDEQGGLRKHVTVFVDGETVQDRENLSDPVGAAGQIYVMQALSGG